MCGLRARGSESEGNCGGEGGHFDGTCASEDLSAADRCGSSSLRSGVRVVWRVRSGVGGMLMKQL
jgi:hypothetical protein